VQVLGGGDCEDPGKGKHSQQRKRAIGMKWPSWRSYNCHVLLLIATEDVESSRHYCAAISPIGAYTLYKVVISRVSIRTSRLVTQLVNRNTS
jgi:hypothetical protein